MATWTDAGNWLIVLFATWILIELILYAREYWRYWRLQDQELERIRRRE
jgi:hypothetical protein